MYDVYKKGLISENFKKCLMTSIQKEKNLQNVKTIELSV